MTVIEDKYYRKIAVKNFWRENTLKFGILLIAVGQTQIGPTSGLIII